MDSRTLFAASTPILLVLLAGPCCAQDVEWLQSPLNGHWYAKSQTGLNWDQAEAVAASFGGHLATIHSDAENTWVFDQFVESPRYNWIGLNDTEVEGTFVWSSGEPLGYENWAPGEPNNAMSGEHHVVLDTNWPYLWNDIINISDENIAGIIEVESDDCDMDGVPDVTQILSNPTLDADGNGVLDGCEGTPVGVIVCTGDGSDGIDCPCRNNSPPGDLRGCRNSVTPGARLTATGNPAVASDSLTLHVASARATQPAVVVQGESLVALPFRDGKLCAGFPTERVEILTLDASGSASSSGVLSILGAIPLAGATRYYQVWYRDPQIGPCGMGSNLTNGLRIDWL